MTLTPEDFVLIDEALGDPEVHARAIGLLTALAERRGPDDLLEAAVGFAFGGDDPHRDAAVALVVGVTALGALIATDALPEFLASLPAYSLRLGELA